MGEGGQVDVTAQRIMDAVERLIIRYGYDKTSLEDIAREAGIARSTLYARWKKKEDLALATIWRSIRRYLDNMLARVEADPEGGTFAGLYRNGLLALADDAFVMSLYTSERQFISRLVAHPNASGLYVQRIELTDAFLKLMQEAGNMRPDVDIEALSIVAGSLQYGFLKLNEALTASEGPSLERVVAVAADMLERYVAPPGGGNSEAGKAAIRTLVTMYHAHIDRVEQALNRPDHR